MKKVVLIGSTGHIGSVILRELINRGHQVTAIARHADKIPFKADNLKVVETDIEDKTSIIDICKGADAVISAYNPGWTNPNIYEDTLKNYSAIVDAVKESGVNRLLIVGGAGTLFVKPGVTVIDSGFIPEEILPAVKGLAEFFLHTLKKEKDIDWVFFSPAGTFLDNGIRTGKFRLGKDDLIVDDKGNSSISVEDYAVAMVDELENERHHKERFTIGY